MAENLFKMKCPACKREMAVIYLIKENIALGVCLKGCGGVFFNDKSFNDIKGDLTPLIRFFENKEFEKFDPKLPRNCVDCLAQMAPRSLGQGDAFLYKCTNCGCEFLDYEEYKKLEELYPKREFGAREPLSQVCVLVKNQQELRAIKEKCHPTIITKIELWLKEKLFTKRKKDKEV